jgi:hypothetical protein
MILELQEQAEQAVDTRTWFEYLSDPTVSFDEKIDRWESFMFKFPQLDLPLEHKFPKGMYVRTIFMPAGSIVVSRIHKQEHPFFITSGKVSVISENEGPVLYEAPFAGVTQPGTRRLLVIHEDCRWSTVHLNPKGLTDPQEIVEDVTELKPTTVLKLSERNW